ncbi:pfkB-like carbohydrate kinase family protein [Striga asiatica]|uniref:PfkB-like carbohydrate kinase family protein n=1 Tax=Striga asiatica TaxID=4170 RepID=A0A5A7PPE2_STRAF|nr:pfkB-like carbohydrate kinase family protein [Striga asiatica]
MEKKWRTNIYVYSLYTHSMNSQQNLEPIFSKHLIDSKDNERFTSSFPHRALDFPALVGGAGAGGRPGHADDAGGAEGEGAAGFNNGHRWPSEAAKRQNDCAQLHRAPMVVPSADQLPQPVVLRRPPPLPADACCLGQSPAVVDVPQNLVE